MDLRLIDLRLMSRAFRLHDEVESELKCNDVCCFLIAITHNNSFVYKMYKCNKRIIHSSNSII